MAPSAKKYVGTYYSAFPYGEHLQPVRGEKCLREAALRRGSSEVLRGLQMQKEGVYHGGMHGGGSMGFQRQACWLWNDEKDDNRRHYL